jgi:hypothetical protein
VKCETLHVRRRSLALVRTGTLYEEVLMPTSLGNKKQTDQDTEDRRMLWLAAITMVLVLAIAAFVRIVF